MKLFPTAYVLGLRKGGIYGEVGEAPSHQPAFHIDRSIATVWRGPGNIHGIVLDVLKPYR